MKPLGFRLSIVILASLGIVGAGNISRAHWLGEPCPVIGVVPACYVVLIGYCVIVLSMHPRLRRASVFFLLGWIPVATLAFFGVIGELTNWLECPRTDTGIPQCYISLSLVLLIGLLSWFLFIGRTASFKANDGKKGS